MQQQIWGEVVDFNLAFFPVQNVTVKTLLKSVYIYQSYCKKNLAQFFLAHPVHVVEKYAMQGQCIYLPLLAYLLPPFL